MIKEEIKFEIDDFGLQPDDLEHLNTAIQELSNKNQQEFEKIKNEKWFTRIIDLATFSKKKDIRMATQISSVAQAQDILVELMKHLSNKDVEISNVIRDNVDDIEKLYGYSEKLAIKVEDIKKKLVLGINQADSINNLKSHELDILAGIIKEASSLFDKTSEEQKQFANSILLYIDRQYMDIDDIEQAIEGIDAISSRRVIAQLLLEYGFLHSLNFDFDDDFEDIVDLFDFGNRTIREIKSSITDIYKLRGVEGFTWFADELGDDDTFNLEFETEIEGLDGNSSSQPENIEIDFDSPKENYIFEKITTIAMDDKVVISNKIIEVDMILQVNGHLEFINCDINFSEEYIPIKVVGGELIFSYCNINSIRNKQTENLTSDNSDNGGAIVFNNCKINNKYKFINNSDLHVTFNNTVISTNFSNCIICKKLIFNSSEFNLIGNDTKYHEKEYRYYSRSIINVEDIHVLDSYFSSDVDSIKVNEDNDFTLIDSHGEYEKIISTSKFEGLTNIFDYDDFNVTGCEFYKCKNIIYNNTNIENSLFTDCRKISYGSNNEFLGCKFLQCNAVLEISDSKIENSYFRDCDEIGLESNNKLTNCEFDNVKSLTSNVLTNSINIEECKFKNVIIEDNNNDNFINNNDNFISINFYDKYNKSSYIKNCLFENIVVKSSTRRSGSIISADTTVKVKYLHVFVENCAFVNCKASNELVSLESYYFPRFSKTKKDVVLGRVENCVGLKE